MVKAMKLCLLLSNIMQRIPNYIPTFAAHINCPENCFSQTNTFHSFGSKLKGKLINPLVFTLARSTHPWLQSSPPPPPSIPASPAPSPHPPTPPPHPLPSPLSSQQSLKQFILFIKDFFTVISLMSPIIMKIWVASHNFTTEWLHSF